MIKARTKVVFNNFPKLTAEMKRNASMVVRKTAEDLQAAVIDSMSESKTGRYYGTSDGRGHRASAPGEAPAIDYGILVDSIQVQMQSDLAAIVSTNEEYALPLEFGSAKMAARPFMKPAADEIEPSFVAAMKQALRV